MAPRRQTRPPHCPGTQLSEDFATGYGLHKQPRGKVKGFQNTLEVGFWTSVDPADVRRDTPFLRFDVDFTAPDKTIMEETDMNFQVVITEKLKAD